MGKIIAYKSDVDGKLFEFEKDYNAHLKILAHQKKKDDKLISDKKNHDNLIQKMCRTVKTSQEIVEFIEKNKEFFIYNIMRQGSFQDIKKIKIDKIIFDKLSIIDEHYYNNNSITPIKAGVKWKNDVSISHSSPIGMETNWSGDKAHLPRSCPGWIGRIRYRLVNVNVPGFSSDIFKATGLNTGSGSGSVENMASYELRLYAQDFKKMAFCSLLEDYNIDKKLDYIRIKHVLKTAPDFIEWDNPEFIKILEQINIKNPQLSSDILQTKITNSNSKNKRKLTKI